MLRAQKADTGGMETTAQLIAAFDSQKKSSRTHRRNIRSSHQGSLQAHDLKRFLAFVGAAIFTAVIGSLFLTF